MASASNLAEAELIQGILLEEGIPSVQRRTRGFDVPDFLAAGPRDILVPEAAPRRPRSCWPTSGPTPPRPPRQPAASARCGSRRDC